MIVLPADLASILGEQPFDALMSLEGEVYRKQPLRETARVELNGQFYFIKKHRGISLGECFKNWFSGRLPVIGAEPEWKAILALNAMHLPTTPLVAYGKRGLWPFTQESFILTQALDHCESLETLIQSDLGLREKRGLIAQVAQITRTLHAQGWVHRDLYLCHFLRDENSDLHLIDLHRMMKPRFCKKRWLVKDLAGLLFSSLDSGLTRHDALFFIKEYCQLPLRDALHAFPIDEVVTRAGALFQQSHHDYPPQGWMHQGKLRLPHQLGPFNEPFHFSSGTFDSLTSLRVLTKRRWVMKGHWQGKLAVLKLFASKRDFHRELKGAQALKKAAIHTPEILYQGREGSHYALIYSYLDHASPVQELNRGLIQVMASLHQAGLLQTDCHRENFLLRDGRLVVLDAGGIRVNSRLTQDQALKNLALLFAQWPAIKDLSHLPLLSEYLKMRNWAETPFIRSGFMAKVANLRAKGRENWLKKIFRNCSDIQCKSRFTYRYCTDRNFESLYTQTLFHYPDAYFHAQAHYLKQGNSATVVQTRLGDRDIVIKRFNRKNWLKRIKRYFTASKAARAWKMSHAMESIGIATPRPLAFIEKRFGPFCLDSYYITEYTPGERLDRLASLNDCAPALNEMMDALQMALCAHGDLKASNILWDGKRIILLDTDGAKFYKSRSAFLRPHEADWERLLRNWEHPIKTWR